MLLIGDIHGCFDLLKQELAHLDYDVDKDILVSLGDLVDRGPSSERCVDFLALPNVYAVRGNHEQMILDANANENSNRLVSNMIRNGGAWFAFLDPDAQFDIVNAFHDLPLGLRIKTATGFDIGITHADLPSLDWTTTQDVNSSPRISELDFESFIWSRTSFDAAQQARTHPGKAARFPKVANIDHVFHGHSICDTVTTLGNRTWMDTDAFATKKLTVLDVDRYLRRGWQIQR